MSTPMSMRNVCAQIVRRKVGSFGCVCFRGAGGENVDETERELVGTQLVRCVWAELHNNYARYSTTAVKEYDRTSTTMVVTL